MSAGRAVTRGLAVCLCVTACGEPTTEPGAVGVYFVPPREAVSTYPVTDVSWHVEGDVARLDYTLPRLLVGSGLRVSFRGTVPPGGGAISLVGAAGSASCVLRPSAEVMLRCDERFTGIRVDLDAVRREALRDDPARVDARVEVSTRFSIEPIGVLEVSAR